MTSTRPARAEIVVDLAAIRHNVRRLREVVGPGVAMMTVVKADGYGHGMIPVARAAREAGSEWLGVATIDEALELRAAGDRGRLLCWLAVPGEDYSAAVAADIDLTAYSTQELDEIAAAGPHARVQLKLDTGLSRGGAARADWTHFFARAAELEQSGQLDITGIWSHFVASDQPDDLLNDAQETAFCEAVDLAMAAGLRPELRHLANSAAAVLRPSARFNLVRCGIAAYGLDPAPGFTHDLDLIPAMTVRASLVMSKSISAGDGVSYGHTWVAERDTSVGIVPAGYAEGIPRAAGNAASVWVDGGRRPIRGQVCMDQFVVDLDGDLPLAGTEVVLFGSGRHGEPTAQDWAVWLGTINYEIVTRLGGRLTRRYVDEEQR